MNKVELKTETMGWPDDEHRADEPGIAEKIYGKIKEWGGMAKKAGVMFKDNPELQKQATMTIVGSVASVAGVKSFYDVPEYLRERYKVRGIFGHGKGVEGSVEDLLSKNWQRRERAGYEPEADYNVEEHTEVKQAIGDLNKRLKLTKEGGQKDSEQRNMIAKLLKENRIAEKNNQQERKEKITEVLDNYTTTKITGIQAARESLNTFLSASGAMALRGVSYGILDGAERYMRLNKEARVKAGSQEQAEQVNFLKDVVVGGFKETWDELRFKDESGKKTGVRKGLDFIKASGKVFRYLGLGYTGLAHPGKVGESVDNLLNGLEGKVSFSDMGKNFVGNIERTYESYKSMPGRLGHLAKAGGGSVAKGAGAAAQYFSASNAWGGDLDENVGGINYLSKYTPVLEDQASADQPLRSDLGQKIPQMVQREIHDQTEQLTEQAEPSKGVKQSASDQHAEAEIHQAPADKAGDKEVEREQIEIGLVRKGKGIEQSLYKQIKVRPNEYGFEGDEKNSVQINKFAQQQAHALAEKMGYVETAEAVKARIAKGDLFTGKREIRVRPADQVAYILGKDEKGLVVKEYYINANGKFKLVDIHHSGDEFEAESKEGINKYEYVQSGEKTTNIERIEHRAVATGHKSVKQISLSDDALGDKIEVEQAAVSPEHDLMIKDHWTEAAITDEYNNVTGKSWRRQIGLSDSQPVSSLEPAKSSPGYGLADKYPNEKLELVVLDNNNDTRVDEVLIMYKGAVLKKYSGLEIKGEFDQENIKKTSLKLESQVQGIISARLHAFEEISEGKVELTQARRLGIEIFDQDGLSPADKAKLEFIKDRGLESGISYEEIKARFKIYDELKDTEIDLKQIDKYYNAVKDIKEPAISAKLIKVWNEPSELNLQNLLEQLKPQDPKAGFEKLTAGKRLNGDLVINYITKGHNEGNYMMVFSANGQTVLERPGGGIDKFNHISDLRKVLSAPAEMIKGAGETEMDYGMKYVTSSGNGEEELPPMTYVTQEKEKK